MKQSWKKTLAVLTSTVLIAGLLTGCGTSAMSNASSYLSEMKRILFTSSNIPNAGSVNTVSGGEKTEIATPADFAIVDGQYSFTGVDNAAQYIIYLCEPGSQNDNDDYLYSGVVSSSGAGSYSGDLRDAVSHAYGDYTAKLFAVAEDYTMSAAASAAYSCSGPLPAPELAWSWDGHSLSLQVANSTGFEYSAMPDSVSVILTGPAGTQNVQFESSLADITVEDLQAGEYTIQAEALCTSAYVTTTSAKAEQFSLALGEEEAASNNYVKPQQNGPGGPGGGAMGGWDVEPENISFEEGAASFSFAIGEHQFLHTTANLMDAPEDGSVYTYDLANGDPGAPFEITMRLQLRADGTAEVTTTAGGPLDASHVYGTWTLADGMISLEW